jgi:hypothetical protein
VQALSTSYPWRGIPCYRPGPCNATVDTTGLNFSAADAKWFASPHLTSGTAATHLAALRTNFGVHGHVFQYLWIFGRRKRAGEVFQFSQVRRGVRLRRLDDLVGGPMALHATQM